LGAAGCPSLHGDNVALRLAMPFWAARQDATKCMFDVESLLPRNDTAITHFSALNRQGELFHWWRPCSNIGATPRAP